MLARLGVCVLAANDPSRQAGRISGTADRRAGSSPSGSPRRPAGGICSNDWTRATLDGLSERASRHAAGRLGCRPGAGTSPNDGASFLM